MVEYDHTSVPGIMYLSLTESKINAIYDDVENEIADTDKLAVYRIESTEEPQLFNIGDEILPVFTLMKNGAPIDLPTSLKTTDKQIARLVNNKLTAVAAGEVDIIIQLVDFPEITKTIHVRVGEEDKPSLVYIEGKDSIRLDREATYELKGTQDLGGEATFSLDETPLAKIVAQNNLSCTIHANDDNKLGEIVLRIAYNDITLTKTISIVPLW